MLEDTSLVQVLARELPSGAGIPPADRGLTCLYRHLGAAAALLGDTKEGVAWYRRAIDACERVRSRPDLALSRLGLAELLLDHYPDQQAEALEHLEFVIAECRAMHMQPALQRALRRKLQHQGIDDEHSRDVYRRAHADRAG